MKKMEWIPGCEGKYKITPYGDVYSYIGIEEKPKKMASFPQMYGYLIINLRFDNKSQTILVHQLVMATYGPVRPFPKDNYVIAHKDKNKSNNHISNLEWRLKRNALGNTRIPVKAIGIDDDDVIYFRSVSDCAKYFHTNPSYVRKKIRDGLIWRGYIFEEIQSKEDNG